MSRNPYLMETNGLEKDTFYLKLLLSEIGIAELRVCFSHFSSGAQGFRSHTAVVLKDLLCVEFEMFPIAIMSL